MQHVMFSSQRKSVLSILLLICVLSLVDHLTGHEFDFSAFYLAPVGLAAWYLGPMPAVGFALLCAAVSFMADHTAGRSYSSHAVAVWNNLIYLTAFMAIGLTVARIRELLTRERQLGERLQRSLAEVKVLEGLLPICATCKRIRTDEGGWEQIERYIEKHSHAQFTHGVCPACARKLLEDAGLAWDEAVLGAGPNERE